MPPKRKAASPESASDGDTEVHNSPEKKRRITKKLDASTKSQEPQRDIESATPKTDDEQKTTSIRKRTAAKQKEDGESQPSRPVTTKKRRGPRNRAEILESLDGERQRAEQAEATAEKLKSQLKDLASKSEQQVDSIKRLERFKLSANGQDKAYLQDDDVIRGNVALLFAKISTWALNWAHGGYLMSNVNTEDAAMTIEMLQGQSKHLGSRVLRDGAIAKCTWANAGCRLAVETFLANTIAKLFLARPLDIPMQSKCGRHTNMEEYSHRIRDGMNDTQVESHLWVSNTLRSHYRPDQYADSIMKPILNDHFQEARMNRYESLVSDWISRKDSPLAPLLKPCEESKAKIRKASMIKILHAATKLGLQLWVQDSEVDVVDNMEDPRGPLCVFNKEIASTHPLMPELRWNATMEKTKIDLLVRPRLQMTKFDSMRQGTRRQIFTKASVVIFDTQVCKKNKAAFENKDGLLSTASEIASMQGDLTGEAQTVSGAKEHADIPRSSPRSPAEATNKSDEALHQPHGDSTDVRVHATQKGPDVDQLMAEPDDSTTDILHTTERPVARSRSPVGVVIDLTGDTACHQSAEVSQGISQAVLRELSQNEEIPIQIPITSSVFPELTEAASLRFEPRDTSPGEGTAEEKEEAQAQEPPAEAAQDSQAPIDKDSQKRQQAGEDLRSHAVSRRRSAESQESQTQHNRSDLANMYDFSEIDPAIEEFHRPLELQLYGDDTEEQHDIDHKEALSHNMICRESIDETALDILDSTNNDNEDKDDLNDQMDLDEEAEADNAGTDKARDKDSNSGDEPRKAEIINDGTEKAENDIIKPPDREKATSDDAMIGDGTNDVNGPTESAKGDAEQVADQHKENLTRTGQAETW